jgi:predicted RND superfamily exporter protein
MSIASFLSLFLVVGLGSDVIFVYTDFWRDSSSVTVREVDRLVWTYQKAGKASLATTFTTSLSFFANLVSVLKPLREFGMFMGLCVFFRLAYRLSNLSTHVAPRRSVLHEMPKKDTQ